MGGIGKTTLAQLVYNDSRAVELFKRAWVCVSENYDGFKIKREILKQVNDSKGDDGLIPTQIDEQLRESLKDAKYLIVLDDMWNDSYADWDKLIIPLKSGAPGSKVIVTTRGENVVSVMRTVPSSYQLRGLDPNDCWLLFEKHAFRGGIVIDQRLGAIGREIVEKCKGLPLAAKMLGGLLRCKRDVSEWEEVLTSNIWDLQCDNILPSLRLSYQHLPAYLKQCFAYCAIFPKDYKMDKEEIIDLWMAEGFLTQPIRRKKMVELGKECFDELVSRSFLQESRKEWGGPSFFLMHDLINDLARQVYGEFLSRIEENDCCEIHEKTRHVSYMATKIDGSKMHESFSQVYVMRTFLTLLLPFALHLEYRFYKVQEEIVDDLLHNQIPRFWSLRVLSLCGYNLMRLPDSIDNLKLLRYLNVARTSLERLPESLCSLFNLQTLILYRCDNLVELPKNIGGLMNMHCLDIRDTPRLEEMPPKIGNLKELRILCKFIVGNQNGLDINELGEIEHLRGALTILKLQYVAQLSKNVLQKKYLEDLELKWSSITEDSVIARSILERLQPHTSVKRLSISGYGGTEFANWIGDYSYTNMVSVELKGCEHCTSLPPLGQLSCLEELSISEFDAVVEIGAEFYGVAKTPFRALKTLESKDMRQWQGWIICEGNNSNKCESFAKLERLTVENCPKLESIASCEPTHKIFKSLHEWFVQCCPNLRTSNLVAISKFRILHITSKQRVMHVEALPSAMYHLLISQNTAYFREKSEEDSWEGDEKCNDRMEGNEEMQIICNDFYFEQINIYGNTLLESISLEMFPKLQNLSLCYCDKLKSLSASEDLLHQPLTSLHCLEISHCPNLISFPNRGIPAPNLTHLVLYGGSNLKSLPEQMHLLLPSLQYLILGGCGEIESFPEGGLPVKLQSLEIRDCNKLIGRLQWGLQRLDALSRLCLQDYDGDDLDFFPENTLLPISLSSLKIISFWDLEVMNCQGLQQLTSLAKLRIQKCPDLQCLLGLPSSLSVLKILDCPELESFPEGGLPANLQSLVIARCSELIGGRSQWGLQRLDGLSHLSLIDYDGDDLQCFPEQTLLPASLGSLMIHCFDNLKFINSEGLQHLTCLHILEIESCTNLQCLPERLPFSLSSLKIWYCDLLEGRCEPGTGEDWPKISHISTIEIDGREQSLNRE